MQDKYSSFEIRRMLDLLDKHIYSSFSEHEESASISSFIDWPSIRLFFPIDSVFLSTLSLYHQTIICESSPNDNFKMCPLVLSCEVNDRGVEIEHNTSALKSYLFPSKTSTIENSYIKEIFINALSKYKLESDVLYDIVSKGKQFRSSPEELKKLLKINYANAMLKSRVLIPIQKSIYNLYQEYLLPFYFTIQTERAIVGSGSKTNGVTINTINHLDMLRLKRERQSYMIFIMERLTELFPFDYPFLEEDIKLLSDESIEEICDMIKNIKQDPDYNKMETSILIKWKLQDKYNIHLSR